MSALCAALLAHVRPAAATPVGTIFSGPTSADAATVYWNPAAMTLMTGTHAMVFGAASFISAHYQRDTLDSYTGQAAPQADLSVVKPDMAPFVVTDAGLERWRFGLGVAFPVIDGANWDTQYGGRPSSTRYYATSARIVQFMIEPAAAVKVNRWLSVGLGIDIIGMWITNSYMTDMGARVNQLACAMTHTPPEQCPLDAPLPRENPNLDAPTDVNGLGWNAGVYGGLLLTPLQSLRLGLSVHSGSILMKVPVSMKVTIPPAVSSWVAQNLPAAQQLLPELSASGEVEIRSPMIIKAGIGWDVTPRLELAADLQWIQKSTMELMQGIVHQTTNSLITSQVLIKAWRDEFAFGLRAAYWLGERWRLALRLEYGPNTRPDDFTTPCSLDLHKFSLHAGAAFLVHPRVALHLEYGHYFLIPRRITHRAFAPNAAVSTSVEEGFDRPSPTGDYWVETERVGGGVTLHF